MKQQPFCMDQLSWEKEINKEYIYRDFTSAYNIYVSIHSHTHCTISQILSIFNTEMDGENKKKEKRIYLYIPLYAETNRLRHFFFNADFL
jgi:hypothetical protein